MNPFSNRRLVIFFDTGRLLCYYLSTGQQIFAAISLSLDGRPHALSQGFVVEC